MLIDRNVFVMSHLVMKIKKNCTKLNLIQSNVTKETKRKTVRESEGGKAPLKQHSCQRQREREQSVFYF